MNDRRGGFNNNKMEAYDVNKENVGAENPTLVKTSDENGSPEASEIAAVKDNRKVLGEVNLNVDSCCFVINERVNNLLVEESVFVQEQEDPGVGSFGGLGVSAEHSRAQVSGVGPPGVGFVGVGFSGGLCFVAEHSGVSSVGGLFSGAGLSCGEGSGGGPAGLCLGAGSRGSKVSGAGSPDGESLLVPFLLQVLKLL
ncbi:hypothetical protein ACOSQ3_002655 [Xanthoceras sorbifolium]